jgi:hypothetical protein
VWHLFGVQILDHLLGHNDSALFRRAQLKALVNIHGKEVSSANMDSKLCALDCGHSLHNEL